MMKKKVIKEIMEFVLTDETSNFEKKLVLIRIMKDLENKIEADGDQLSIVLLRLRYGVKQGIPKRWKEVIAIPSEIDMAGNFLREQKVQEEQKKRETGRTLKFVDKAEKENKTPAGVKLVML